MHDDRKSNSDKQKRQIHDGIHQGDQAFRGGLPGNRYIAVHHQDPKHGEQCDGEDSGIDQAGPVLGPA